MTVESNLISYDMLMERVAKQQEAVIASKGAFESYVAGLAHGETSIEYASESAKYTESAIAGMQKKMGEIDLGDEDSQKTLRLSVMAYLTERDLFGPLIYHFAKSITTWQQEGKLPGKTVAMLRDAQPFYVAMQALGADVHPKYLRRAMFAIDDELSPEDEATIGASLNGKLAVWLSDIFTPTHVTLVDSGCWGTVVYDVAALRSFISWFSSHGIASELMSVQSALRPHVLHEKIALPQELLQMLNTGLQGKEVSTRWGIIHTLIQDNSLLEHFIKPQTFTTTALDHYSHAWRDTRFSQWNHQHIWSHIDVMAGHAVPAWFGEVINDSIEENLASKIYKGPTQLYVEADGAVHEMLEINNLQTHIIATAASLGAHDAVVLAEIRQKYGLSTIVPEQTAAHMFARMQEGKQKGIWTGVLPEQTPTWSDGGKFLSKIWPNIQNNPFSTYKPFDPDTGVGV